MSNITEYLYRHTTVMHDNVFSLTLRTDGTVVTTTPTRFILTLTNDDSTITMDTDTATYDLGVAGTTENFRFDTATGILTVDIGGDAIATFPAGSYEAELIWYDASNTNGIVWGPWDKLTVVIE